MSTWNLQSGIPHLDVQFEDAPAPWAEWDWIAPLGYQMAVDEGGPPSAVVRLRLMMGVGL